MTIYDLMFIKKIITAMVSVKLSGCGGESLDQYAPTNLNFIKKYLSFNLHDTRNIKYEKSTVFITLLALVVIVLMVLSKERLVESYPFSINLLFRKM